jgi:hypothetical protein
MTQYQVRVDDRQRFQVYATTNGTDRRDVGPAWETPRDAIAYADKLADVPDVSPLREDER